MLWLNGPDGTRLVGVITGPIGSLLLAVIAVAAAAGAVAGGAFIVAVVIAGHPIAPMTAGLHRFMGSMLPGLDVAMAAIGEMFRRARKGGQTPSQNREQLRAYRAELRARRQAAREARQARRHGRLPSWAGLRSRPGRQVPFTRRVLATGLALCTAALVAAWAISFSDADLNTRHLTESAALLAAGIIELHLAAWCGLAYRQFRRNRAQATIWMPRGPASPAVPPPA